MSEPKKISFNCLISERELEPIKNHKTGTVVAHWEKQEEPELEDFPYLLTLDIELIEEG